VRGVILFGQVDGRIQAGRIERNRLEGMDDDDGIVGWDLPDLGNAWEDRVKDCIPSIEEDEMSLLYQIREDTKRRGDIHEGEGN
jgi:hypothetical protein